MNIILTTSLEWAKEIKGWNLFSNAQITSLSSSPGSSPSMTITKQSFASPTCTTGVDTIVLCKAMFLGVMTGLYSFDPTDFWDFWGGCNVDFRWFRDDVGSNIWGEDTPQPTYPIVPLPDGTLMVRTVATMPSTFFVVFGGAAFTIPNMAVLSMLGLNPASAVPFMSLDPTPVDFTLVRELNSPAVYVVYGGAKFWIPDPATLFSLGFNWSNVRVIPPSETNQLRTIPFDGTLIKEQHDPRVYLVANQALSWVTSPSRMVSGCLPWRHVRTVPDNALAALPRGPDV